RVAQRVVAADGDQEVQAQCADVLKNLRCEVIGHRRRPVLHTLRPWEVTSLAHGRQAFYFGRVGARAVQIGSARAVNRASILAVEGKNVTGTAGRIFQIDVCQAFPSSTDTDNLAV